MVIKYKTMTKKGQKTLKDDKKTDFVVCFKHLMICSKLCPYCKEENAKK